MADRPHAHRVLVMHLEGPPGSGLTACTGAPLPIYPPSPSVPFEACTGCAVLGPRLSEERAAHEVLRSIAGKLLDAGARIEPVGSYSPGPVLACPFDAYMEEPAEIELDAAEVAALQALVDLKGTGA